MDYCKQRDTLYQIFLSKDVSKEDYLKNPMGFNLPFSYHPISLNRKAYSLLEDYATQSNIVNDSLVTRSVALYLNAYRALDDNQGRISKDIDTHLADLTETEDWIIDMMRGSLTDPMMDYFTSKKYQSKLFVHVMYVKGNLLQQLYLFKRDATELLIDIDKRLEKNES